MKKNLLDLYMRRLCLFFFHLDEWYAFDYYDKDYAQYVTKTVNKMVQNAPDYGEHIIELGCGLGDVIGNIETKYKKIGFDIDRNVIRSAKILHPDIKFLCGSFDNIKNMDIYCLIMVNFLHFINPVYSKRKIKELLDNNHVSYVILDELRNTEKTLYKYEVFGKMIMGEEYVERYRSKRLPAAEGAYRKIVVYENKFLSNER